MSSRSVLVVEDEGVAQLHLRRLLEELGYSVSGVASSSREALDSAARRRPDLVLMDIRLGEGADGIETAAQLRDLYDVPVVFLTAHADDTTLGRARAVEPAGYVVKPYTSKDVQAAVVTAFAKHGAVRRIKDHGKWLETILQSIRDCVIVTDASGAVTFLNQAAEELLGRGAERALGEPVAAVCRIREQGKEAAAGAVRRARDTDRKIFLADAVLSVDSEPDRAVQLTAAPLLGPGQKREGVVLIVHDLSARRKAEQEAADLRRLLDREDRFHGMIGKSRVMETVYQQIQEVAGVDWTVLIQGETGSGKELVARAIHAEGPRADGPFVPVNTAGLTESLLASQLFGHKKGAFTGATTDQRGLFEVADGGTLFLDEVGDVPPAVQMSLLRVLEDRQVTPLGGRRPRKIDVRFLAATHRDLAREVGEGAFREDLLYRLRVARIELPPLRERHGDVQLLANWFLERAAASAGKPVRAISDTAWELLNGHAWPGNVRELRSAIEHAVIRCQGDVIQPGDLPAEVFTSLGADPERAIVEALAACGGNRTAAARRLGIGRATLYRRMAELGIDPEQT